MKIEQFPENDSKVNECNASIWPYVSLPQKLPYTLFGLTEEEYFNIWFMHTYHMYLQFSYIV